MNFKLTKLKIIISLIIALVFCLPVAIIINEISPYSLIIGQRTGHEILYSISQLSLVIIAIIIFIVSYVMGSLWQGKRK